MTERNNSKGGQGCVSAPGKQSADELRRTIKDWMRAAWRKSGKPQRLLGELLGEPGLWLQVRMAYSANVVPERHHLDSLARLADHPLSADVVAARTELDRRRGAGFTLPAKESLSSVAATAEAEMQVLIELAHEHQSKRSAARNCALMRMRFGIDGAEPSTLAEVGSRFGVTRERVRQVEAKMLRRLFDSSGALHAPALDAVAAAAAARPGMPVAAVQSEMQDLLGAVQLTEAVRFWQAFRGDEEGPRFDVRLIGGKRVAIIGGARLTRLANVAATGARKAVSYAGACMVGDLRAFVESEMQAVIKMEDLVGVVSAIPGAEWLDSGKRWLWFGETEMTALVSRAREIVGLAGCPVSFDVLYGGLAKESRRTRVTGYSQYCDAIPPPAVVLAILDRHRAFRRTAARSYELTAPWCPDDMHGFERELAAVLLDHGGVAARSDFVHLTRRGGGRWSEHSLGQALGMAGFIERIGPALHAIRGRALAAEAVADAQARTQRDSAERPTYQGGAVVVKLEVTETLNRRRQVFFRPSEIPAGIDGAYSLGSQPGAARLVDDLHGVRLQGVGATLRRALEGAPATIEWTLWPGTRRITWRSFGPGGVELSSA